MTFEYTDRDGDTFLVLPLASGGPGPIVSLIAQRADGRSNGVIVPVDRVEEVVAGIRDAARQAAGQPAGCVCGQPDTTGVVHRPGAPCYVDEVTHIVADDSDDPEHVDDCPGCEAGIEHDEHCPTPETHNWGCGCPTDKGPAARAREITPRERLGIMIRTSRHSMTVWSASEVQDALDTYRAAVLSEAADTLPEQLRATLTERYAENGNPFSRMEIHFQGPDGWPAAKPVGPNVVAEVLQELLRRMADEAAQ